MNNTVPTLTSDERYILHTILGGCASRAEQLDRLESLHQRDVITSGEAQRIKRAIQMGWGS